MNPRRVLKRYLGSRDAITRSRLGAWFGQRLHDPELWHIGRRSIAEGVGLGFCIAFIPLPVHMLVAVPAAILMRVNLPVTLAAVWLTNPLTVAPMFLFAIELGAWVTGRQARIRGLHFDPSWQGMTAIFDDVWLPLVVGCCLCGAGAGILGNLTVRGIWRACLLWRRRRRRQQRGHDGDDLRR